MILSIFPLVPLGISLCLLCLLHTARAKAADEKFVKLREVYQKLRGEHIVLLRTNGETQKKLLTTEKVMVDIEGEAKVDSIMKLLC